MTHTVGVIVMCYALASILFSAAWCIAIETAHRIRVRRYRRQVRDAYFDLITRWHAEITHDPFADMAARADDEATRLAADLITEAERICEEAAS